MRDTDGCVFFAEEYAEGLVDEGFGLGVEGAWGGVSWI
jgi:hypothetical protein